MGEGSVRDSGGRREGGRGEKGERRWRGRVRGKVIDT